MNCWAIVEHFWRDYRGGDGPLFAVSVGSPKPKAIDGFSRY